MRPMSVSPRTPRNHEVAPLTPEEIVARILYRDALILVIDKPPGLPVHLGPGGGATLEQSFEALRFGLPRPPALAHRLDRDTSGCLALGRNRAGLQKLGELFASGAAQKTYWAVVSGTPSEAAGTITLPLKKRSDDRRSWRMMVADDGQPAITDYVVRGAAGGLSWLELSPRTGRTHQLRVHCAAIGCPILGDWVYGPREQRPEQGWGTTMHLHARALVLPFYPRKPAISVEAPPPPHMGQALADCGYQPA